MDLYLLRHGKAQKADAGSGNDDDRLLTGNGRSEIRDIAAWICSQRCDIACVATSPLKRARETAAIVTMEFSIEAGPEIWGELAPGVEFDRLIYRIKEHPLVSSLMLVGHEPSLSWMIARIIAGKGNVRIQLKRGGLAKIENFFPAGTPSGDLVWLLAPRQMRK